MINLFENYGELEEDLVYSLEQAGGQYTTIVLNEDGFLPQGVTSPIAFFTGLEERKKQVKRSARFFNDLTLPSYWEIRGTNGKADIWDGYKKKADINYSVRIEDFRKIKEVGWLNDSGGLRAMDLYDQTGERFGRRTYSDGEHVLTSYFNKEGQEIILMNHLRGTVQVNYQEKNYFFSSFISFILFYFKIAQINTEVINYNFLGNPFFISNALKNEAPDKDFNHILFWQEESTTMPGNMASIFSNPESPTKQIVVQNKEEYIRLESERPIDSPVKLSYLGINYHFKKSPVDNPSVFVHTNSDQVAQLNELISSFPEVHFNISARTEMSTRLTNLNGRDNVTLYESISTTELEEQLKSNRYYLDINYGNEVDHIVRQAFENNLLILGFNQTLHNTKYIASNHRFDVDDFTSFTEKLRAMMTENTIFDKALQHQHQFAGFASVEEYKEVLGIK